MRGLKIDRSVAADLYVHLCKRCVNNGAVDFTTSVWPDEQVTNRKVGNGFPPFCTDRQVTTARRLTTTSDHEGPESPIIVQSASGVLLNKRFTLWTRLCSERSARE